MHDRASPLVTLHWRPNTKNQPSLFAFPLLCPSPFITGERNLTDTFLNPAAQEPKRIWVRIFHYKTSTCFPTQPFAPLPRFAHTATKIRFLHISHRCVSFSFGLARTVANLTPRSRQSLKKYVRANNNITVSDNMFDSLFNKALKAGVEKGVFEQPKGMSFVRSWFLPSSRRHPPPPPVPDTDMEQGASGGTKLAKKKATKPAATKKAAPKKDGAKTATKKAAPKKAAPKKETKEKKPAAAKKDTKKAATKKTSVSFSPSVFFAPIVILTLLIGSCCC